MANAAQKKLALQNKRILMFMLVADVTVNFLFVLLRFFLRSPLSKFSKLLYIFAAGSSGFLHYQLYRAAAPKYDSKGALLYVGQDLLQQGVTSYMIDYMYFSWIVIFLSALTSTKFFALYLLVPIFVGYKAFPLLRMGLEQLQKFRNQGSNDPASSVQEEPTASRPLSKRQEKLRKKSNKYHSG
ncbi:DUF788 family protein [Schizosaccharomyces cryophilus OY26]|uniref:DUF788 family protein n=1 Tax=Schizosaccharomyces cryophilus (strain OY26 / ATCC MYA-4695 / CBS 11777 / NBRC 106824 / NRRL Y48691) TaxID=653667 RepID=S9X187_SCHCR|nr:DUF788 family protein [Schizosaccharomyces cryophilus OY26]EPY50877.1 DUF788 family protein [Schizosaccharomyces cryophilus OY26]